ncbi:MAG: FtsH protease activity modulator HflK [Alphaproteobacteria bacterium]|nr:FtsH protease activity modulator HflK [Alphaproteobacteria bacterium]
MSDNNNPWENKDSNPWSKNKDNKSSSEDEIEFLMKKASEFKGNNDNNGSNRRVIKITINFKYILFFIIGIWLLTGIYQVQPQEAGVVLRFGKYDRTTEPGLHYHLPYPIEGVLKPNVSRENRIEIGFGKSAIKTQIYNGNKYGFVEKDDRFENNALTGDENIVEINFTVTWKVKNANDYLFNVRDPETTIKVAAESAMRDAIGVTPIMNIIADDRKEVQKKAYDSLQKVLDDYKSGIALTSVQLTKADAPSQVIDAFNDVQRAKADKERLSNEAEAYRNDVLPRAKGEASQIIAKAEAYKAQVIDVALGDTARYKSVLNEYLQAKEVVAKRLYLETMEEVFGSTDKVLLNSNGGVLPYLPLKELKKTQEIKIIKSEEKSGN